MREEPLIMGEEFPINLLGLLQPLKIEFQTHRGKQEIIT